MPKIKAYKGFNKDMTCRGFQYEEGKDYETDKAELCESGFHACERPLDVFNFYEPATSVYHEVELDGDTKSDSEKTVATKIHVGGRLNIPALVEAHIEYTKSRCTTEHTDPNLATAGDSGAATAGDFGVATSRGSSSVGENGIACARGNGCRVKGGLGAVLVIAEEEETTYNLKQWRAVVVDGEKIKADTWYTLKGRRLVEVKENG